MTHRERGSSPSGIDDVQARFMLAVLCLIWGFGWPAMKIALNEMPPLTMRALSAALAAITLTGYSLLRGRSLRLRTAKAFGHVVIASLLNIVGFTLLTAYAQLEAATSRVAILAYTVPIWSALFAWPVLGERPRGVQTWALGLCALGLGILIYPLAHSGIPLGIVLALGSGVSWGAGTVYLKWARIDADPIGVASWQLIVAFVGLAVTVLAVDGGLDVHAARADGIGGLLFTGVMSGGAAYGLWFEIVRRVPAATAALGVLSAPVIGVLSSMVILGEMPTATDVIGFVLILAASACVMLGPQQIGRSADRPSISS